MNRDGVQPLDRRTFLAGLATVAATAACADDGDSGADDSQSTGSEPLESASTTPAASAPADASTTPPAVVDLADNIFDLAVLGVAPVANIYGRQFLEPVMGYLDLDTDVRAGVLASGSATAEASFDLNLEAIAASEPDLILITDQFAVLFDEAALASVREIADLVVIPDGGTWQARSRAIAAAVGLDGVGEERVAAAEDAIGALGALVAERGLTGREVSTLRFALDQFLAFIPPALCIEIITSAGLAIPAATGELTKASAFPDYHAQAFVSAELLGDFDADLLVLAEAVPDDGDNVTAQPTIAEGRAVTSAAVQRVPYFLWALNSAVGVSQICEDMTTGIELLA